MVVGGGDGVVLVVVVLVGVDGITMVSVVVDVGDVLWGGGGLQKIARTFVLDVHNNDRPSKKAFSHPKPCPLLIFTFFKVGLSRPSISLLGIDLRCGMMSGI